MRLFRSWIMLVLIAAPALRAGTEGILQGTVRDKKTGEPLPGATVLIVELRLGIATDASGQYQLRNIHAGTYSVRFAHIGYTSTIIKNVTVVSDLRATLDARLEASDVELDEIVVTQEKPLIQKDVTGTTYLVSGGEIQMLPVQNLGDVIGLKAGVTLEGNVRGGKKTDVSYLVDGLPVQDLMGGGGASTLPASSVFGMSLYTGGFEPEYGNALSGVVNIVTRTGGDAHKFYVRADNDQFSLPLVSNLLSAFTVSRWGTLIDGKQTNQESDVELFASGPVAAQSLFYTAAVRGTSTNSRWWQDFQYFFGWPVERNLSGFGKLDWFITPTMRLGGQVLYSHRGWRDYEFPWRFNLAGLPAESKNSNRIAVVFSYTPSEQFSFTSSLSRYDVANTINDGSRDAAAQEAPWQYDFFLRYIVAGNRAWWARSEQESYTAKFDGILTVTKDQMMKFGAEATTFNLHSDIVRFEPRMTYFGKPLANMPMLDFSSAYHYLPRSGSAYIQDKIDVMERGGLLNIGIRYDFLDTRARRPAVGGAPSDSAAGITSAPVSGGVKQAVSPRFGAAFQIDEKSYLFVNLGWYVQFPLFDYLYTGLDRVGMAKGVSALSGNPGLEPERSRMLELSYKHVLSYGMVISCTYFKKSTTNLIDTKSFVAGDSKLSGSFGYAEYVNNPYGEASGIEITLARERGEWVTGELSYTYMNAEATSGSSTEAFYAAQYGTPVAARIYPLSWDQKHAATAIVNLTTPVKFDAHLVVRAHTGRPYTYYPTSTGFEPIDAGLFTINNARMAGYASIDLRLEQHAAPSWWEGATLTAYIDMRNVLNAQNVTWVDSNGKIGGELGDPSGYAIGRRTRIGIRAEF